MVAGTECDPLPPSSQGPEALLEDGLACRPGGATAAARRQPVGRDWLRRHADGDELCHPPVADDRRAADGPPPTRLHGSSKPEPPVLDCAVRGKKILHMHFGKEGGAE